MDRRPVGRTALVAAVTIALVGAWSAAAGASVGAGVGANPLVLAQPARPSSTYRLPDLLVVNTGSDPATYRLEVTREPGSRHRAVPPAWVHFSSTTFQLEAGARRDVPIELTVPASVATGSYDGYVVASALTPSSSDAHAGAAAATILSFSVRPGPPAGFPWKPWLGSGAAAIILGGLVVAVRRSGIRITVERRTRHPATR